MRRALKVKVREPSWIAPDRAAQPRPADARSDAHVGAKKRLTVAFLTCCALPFEQALATFLLCRASDISTSPPHWIRRAAWMRRSPTSLSSSLGGFSLETREAWKHPLDIVSAQPSAARSTLCSNDRVNRSDYSRITVASTSKSMGSIASLGTGTRVCAGSASPNMSLTFLVNTSSLDMSWSTTKTVSFAT